MKQFSAKLKKCLAWLPEWLRQLLGFGLVGAINIIVQYGLYYLLLHVRIIKIEWYYTFCNLISIFATWIVSYVLYSRFVFKSKNAPDQSEEKNHKLQLQARRTSRMIITNVGYLMLSSALIIFFVETCGISEKIASLVCIGVLIPYNFLLNKLWVHKNL